MLPKPDFSHLQKPYLTQSNETNDLQSNKKRANQLQQPPKMFHCNPCKQGFLNEIDLLVHTEEHIPVSS